MRSGLTCAMIVAQRVVHHAPRAIGVWTRRDW
jgi:hypothetical protein